MSHDHTAWTDPELSYLLEYGARMDADRERLKAEREARAAEEAYEEEFWAALDRLEAEADVAEDVEVAPWESPTGVLCSRCRMPATRYQLPTLELVLGVWSAPLALCGVCSELELRRAHELGDTGQDYEEWRRELEDFEKKMYKKWLNRWELDDEKEYPCRAGMLTPRVLEARKGRYETSTTCHHPGCREEGIYFLIPYRERVNDQGRSVPLRKLELDQALQFMKRRSSCKVKRFCADHRHQALERARQQRRSELRRTRGDSLMGSLLYSLLLGVGLVAIPSFVIPLVLTGGFGLSADVAFGWQGLFIGLCLVAMVAVVYKVDQEKAAGGPLGLRGPGEDGGRGARR